MTDTIRLTPMQHADAVVYSWLSYAMHRQTDPQAHMDAAYIFLKMRARARKVYEYTQTHDANNGRQRKAQERARADVDGLIAALAERAGEPESIRATHNQDGTVTLTCGPRGIVLGKTHGA